MDGSNVKEVFTTVAQNHLKIQNEVNGISTGTEGSTAHAGTNPNHAGGGAKKFDLEKQKESTGKKKGKCCGGSG